MRQLTSLYHLLVFYLSPLSLLPWHIVCLSLLLRCQGCLIPDNDLPGLYLRDGETVAVDWNMVVYEELLDVSLASEVIDCVTITLSQP
jgi:hypothetical protein